MSQAHLKAVPSDAGTQSISIRSNVSITVHGKSPGQNRLIEAFNSPAALVAAVGPAGTGKTYLAAAYAYAELCARRCSQVILTRPAVAAEELGFLPGEASNKVAPYLRPLVEILASFAKQVDRSVRRYQEEKPDSDGVRVEPVAFLRGLTFDNAIVVLDEAQNCTADQIYMIATRLGANSRLLACASPEQCDLPKGKSGLNRLLKTMNHASWPIVTLTAEDIQRSEFVRQFVDAWDNTKVT